MSMHQNEVCCIRQTLKVFYEVSHAYIRASALCRWIYWLFQ